MDNTKIIQSLSNLLILIKDNAEEEQIDQAYLDLNSLIKSISNQDKIYLLSNFLGNLIKLYNIDTLENVKNFINQLNYYLVKFDFSKELFNVDDFSFIFQFYILKENHFDDFIKQEFSFFRQKIFNNINNFYFKPLRLLVLNMLLTSIINENKFFEEQELVQNIIAKMDELNSEIPDKEKLNYIFPSI